MNTEYLVLKKKCHDYRKQDIRGKEGKKNCGEPEEEMNQKEFFCLKARSKTFGVKNEMKNCENPRERKG